MKSAAILLFAVLVLCSCVRLSDRGFDRAKFAEDAHKDAAIRLADYTSFDWDRVHIFAPYTPADLIRDEVGSRVPFPHSNSEDHCLVVFMSGRRIAAAFEVDRKPADFAQLFRKTGYSREEADFTVEVRASDHWRYLQKKQAKVK